jgi:hypothetical protein
MSWLETLSAAAGFAVLGGAIGVAAVAPDAEDRERSPK